jgi:hypothetical protein
MDNRLYRVRDNGLRCFVPPCFSWDVIDIESNESSTASDLDLSPLGVEGEEARQLHAALVEGEHRVRGHLQPYIVAGGGAIPESEGMRLVVTEVVGPVQ